MRRSRDRILTTHTGTLPRPADLDQLIGERKTGADVDQAAFDKRVERAVANIVASQLAAGVSVISDGEMGQSDYATYVKDRLNGFGPGRLTCRPSSRSRPARRAAAARWP
jgi:5-methyltetrahydropteroyltriglutamate--homocysteine methyltransferase